MDEREIKRYVAWKKCKALKRKRMDILIQLGKVNEEHRQAKLEYESLDRELMMEKRTILTPQGNPTKRIRKPRDLTMEEIHILAAKLGVNLK